MSAAKDIFDLRRFARVLLNDLILLQGRRVAFASLGLIGAGTLVYLLAADAPPPEAPQALPFVMFLFLLYGAGQVFTSMIFSDMHHPLERFHYLTLPCSNLERFASRYLITAPLFLLYALVLFKLFEVFANGVRVLLTDAAPVASLDFSSANVRDALAGYFVLHIPIFMGAIWFRSYSLIKTWVASTLFWCALGAVFFIAVRIIYWDSFIGLFETNPEGPYLTIDLPFGADGMPLALQKALAYAFLLWLLFLAYLGLKEHEVQDGV